MYSKEMTALWNSDNEQDWKDAEDLYWSLIKPNNLQVEKEIDALEADRIESMSVDEFYDFLYEKYYKWKFTIDWHLDINRGHLSEYKNDKNKKDELESIHEKLFSFDKNDIREGIDLASKIRGLATAGASGLLAILFPEYFGTVDQFLVKSLLSIEGLEEHEKVSKIKPNTLNLNDAVILIEILRNKAKELNKKFETDIWTPRKIDKILWAYREKPNTCHI